MVRIFLCVFRRWGSISSVNDDIRACVLRYSALSQACVANDIVRTFLRSSFSWLRLSNFTLAPTISTAT